MVKKQMVKKTAKEDSERVYVILQPNGEAIVWLARDMGAALKEWADDRGVDDGTEVRIIEVSEMPGFTVERTVAFAQLKKEPR